VEWDTNRHYQLTFYFLSLILEGEVVIKNARSIGHDPSVEAIMLEHGLTYRW